MNFNFDKPPVVEQKKDNSVEGKRTNWEKSKKYLKMLALGGFITLATFGGKYQVPCLRITQENNEDNWLYESDDIILYLKNLT